MVTILLATRITFLTLIENSVILDVLRITFLDEKSNSRCWYSPSKIDFYVVFSNFPKSFRVGWGWGRQCLTIAKQHVYTRMVHFSFCIEFQFVPFLYCQNGPKKQQSRNRKDTESSLLFKSEYIYLHLKGFHNLSFDMSPKGICMKDSKFLVSSNCLPE